MSVLLALVLASAPIVAQPGGLPAPTVAPIPAGKVTLRNMASVVAALQKEGYRAKLVTEDKKVHIESASNGAKFYIYPENCGDKGECKDLMIRASYNKLKDKPITVAEINDFNRESRWVRGYLDKEGDPIVEMDILFTDQQIDEAMFIEAIQVWQKMMGQFHTAIRF